MIVGELTVPQTAEDIDQALGENKRFKDLLASHSQIEDMLAEDCSHLLRKAQTALSKASSGGSGGVK